ncbi:hypothetical protein CS063_01620 [Sporanaerobium hydrogeniformans]|uniref:Uncharacterized protein n=1 Tax=Sporanaerobium hydrogeniformans TaxID=3072179 RepID=A0AC61DG28_9FIRM|nr:hypothetical protein [Sporanaerobium hydrogeniformans]PHV72199.1 hypothetical protein CS063_01620 [Sporanaerobium hydrogeniformans]
MTGINLFILIAVLFLSIIIGTAIRLYIVGVKNILIFSIYIPVLLCAFTVNFITQILKENRTLSLFEKIVVGYKILFFIISQTPILIGLGCTAVMDAQEKYKKKPKDQYRSSKTSYRDKFDNLCRLA